MAAIRTKTPRTIADVALILCGVDVFAPNDERMHHYQRGRTSITGLMLELRKSIETGRLVVVAMTRLVLRSFYSVAISRK